MKSNKIPLCSRLTAFLTRLHNYFHEMANPYATLTRLPVELQEIIVAHISSPQTLASLNQTCKAFHHLTEGSLYQSVLIHTGKMGAFAAALQKNSTRKAMIHTLDVDYIGRDYDGEDIDYSACTFAPLFAEFAALKTLKLTSPYWDDGIYEKDITDDCELVDRVPVEWSREHKRLDDAFKQGCLLTPPEQRIWNHLKSVTLDFYAQEGALLHWEPSIFLIDTLEELIIRGMHVQETNGKDLFDSPRRGTTQLKKLAIERSGIARIALQRFLSMPKALTHLTLEHYDLFEIHENGDMEDRLSDMDNWDTAFEQQKESLEFLSINDGPWDRKDIIRNFRKYPRLRLFETFETYPEGHWCYNADDAAAMESARGYCEVRLFKDKYKVMYR